MIKLDLRVKEQTEITQPTGTAYGDYSVFYHSKSKRAAYIRQSTTTGSELRIYDLNQQSHRHIKTYAHPLVAVTWLNARQIVAQTDSGYEVINLSESSIDSIPIVFNEVEQLQFSFFIDERTIGFVRGPITDYEITLHDLNTKTTDHLLTTLHDEYKIVVTKETKDQYFARKKKHKHQLFYRTGNKAVPITDLPKNDRILDMAASPDGKLVAYTLGNTLFVKNRRGKTVYQRALTTLGFTFSPDSKQLLVGQRFGKASSIISLSTQQNFKTSKITAGFLPKITRDSTLYFLRQLNSNDINEVWLFRQTDTGEEKIMKAPFSTAQPHSNYFDVIDHYLFYIEKENLIRYNLKSGDKVVIKKVKGNHFSMNYEQNFMATVHPVTPRNNLIEFKLKYDDGSE